MNTRKIRVGLTAHTILYWPLYEARSKCLRLKKPIELILNTVGDDSAAIEALNKGDFDLCVCDPAFADQSKHKNVRIIGKLVETVALWAVRRRGVAKNNLQRVVTHVAGTSAFEIAKRLKRDYTQVHGITDLRGVAIGQEFRVFSESPEVDTIITSDILGAFAFTRANVDAVEGNPQCLGATDPFNVDKPFLFTGLLASGNAINSMGAEIAQVCAKLQQAMITFHDTQQTNESNAVYNLAEAIASYRELNTEALCDEDLSELSKIVLSELQSTRVIAQDLIVELGAYVERILYST